MMGESGFDAAVERQKDVKSCHFQVMREPTVISNEICTGNF
jgi:hypothetical protein